MTDETSKMRIGPLGGHEVAAASRIFARAFDDDANAVLIAPDPEERRRFQERAGLLQIERSMPYRHVFGVREANDLRGIAVWLPPGVTVRTSGAPPLTAIPRIAAAVARSRADAVRMIRERRQALAHAHAEPAWHLAFLATDPDHQRRGIGGRLLRHILTRADEDRTPVWLETSNPRNVPLYEKFGFATLAHVDGGLHLPTFWVMVRSAVHGSDLPSRHA